MVFYEKIYYFCAMNTIHVAIISKSDDLPVLYSESFFHSARLFSVVENTPSQWPYMVIAYDGDMPVAHLLVIMRRRGSLVPPYLFTQARIYGEGIYADGYNKEELFSYMLQSIVKKFSKGLCLYIEFSEMSSKMFGYKTFRDNGFFPVHWMEIHNSLHSKHPRQRLSHKMRLYLVQAHKLNMTAHDAQDDSHLDSFYRMLVRYSTDGLRRFIPDKSMFRQLINNGDAHLYYTLYKDKMVAGCISIDSANDCYLWYITAKKNIYRKRAIALSAWTAISHAYQQNRRHIYFMDVGLPFRKNRFRDFILRFGGKPVGTYRWFRCSVKWLNKLLTWIYRE